MDLKIALLQITPGKSLEENRIKGEAACRKAKEMGADIALFPEMFSNGYDIYDRPPSVWQKEAIGEESDFVRFFAFLAKELDMAIAITYLEKHDPSPRNSMILFDRFGEKRFSYAKVHTCDFGEEKHLTPGDDFFVATLSTRLGPVQVGGMIC